MDLEEITLFEKLSQLEAYQGISNSTCIIPSSIVLSPLLNNEIHLFVRISIPQCYACQPLRLFLSIQKSAIGKKIKHKPKLAVKETAKVQTHQ